jgi:carboxypeptidase D
MSQEVPSAASFFVPSLPGLPSLSAHGLSLFAGNLPATIQSLPQPSDQDLAHLFFLLTTNKHIPKRQRLLIFLQGGPGCSSLLGA